MVFTVFCVFTTVFRTVFNWFSRFSQNGQLLGRKQEGKPSTTGWCEKKAPEQSQTYREVSCLPIAPLVPMLIVRSECPWGSNVPEATGGFFFAPLGMPGLAWWRVCQRPRQSLSQGHRRFFSTLDFGGAGAFFSHHPVPHAGVLVLAIE